MEFFTEAKSEDERTAIEKGLHNPKSPEYKNAFINWYFSGRGDKKQRIGENYKVEESE